MSSENSSLMRFGNSSNSLTTAMAIILILESLLKYNIFMSLRFQKCSHNITAKDGSDTKGSVA
ncbi:hypothetical protein P5673_009522 [Acropora cervicornis]|uniref:Uncharacterized protein n=1 Tax=Acropora cervicornis TaxID=6130 RepID=A0AAD9VA29_ACRCE|nr:hypothetical protein P5673_009522 [Acropora cervicornis]